MVVRLAGPEFLSDLATSKVSLHEEQHFISCRAYGAGMNWWKRRNLPSSAESDREGRASRNEKPDNQWDFFIADSRPIPVVEINEIANAVAPGRQDDLAAVISRGHTNSYLSSEVVCLAAIIDIPGHQLAAWPRFQQERDQPQHYMWDDALNHEPSFQGLVEPGLSYSARLVLAAQGSSRVTYRRSEAEMVEKYLLTHDQVVAVRDELEAAGLARWGAPTVTEAVAALTVSDLAPMFERIPVKKTWTKARKLEALFAEVAEEDLRRFVLGINTAALDEMLNIRFINEVDHKFHRAWARLAGHYISFCGYRDRNWDELKRYRGTELEKQSRVSSEPVDDCARCLSASTQINLKDKGTWPPFHLGCRCSVTTHF